MGDGGSARRLLGAALGAGLGARAPQNPPMPPFALGLVLTAALLHALWNIVAKRQGDGPHFALLSALAMTVLWAPLGLWLTAQGLPRWGAREYATMAGSGIVHLVYFNVLLAGYRKADLTVVYPVARGTGPFLAALGALALLGEQLTLAGGLGIAAIPCGVWLLAGGHRLWRDGDDEHRRKRRSGLAYGTATGLLIALYTLIDGYAVKVLALAPVLVDWMSNLLRTLMMLPRAARDPAGVTAELRARWPAVLVLGVFSPLGYILVLYAAQLAPLSHVAPTREVSMLFAALLGGKLLGEGERALRLCGAALIAAGVIALAWS